MTHIVSIPIEVRLTVLFVLGCCVGAVINLGIYRLAWNSRPIGPWSRRHADTPPRRVWDRVPVIGWLGLRREAAVLGAGFWIRPMSLELLTGAVFALLYWWEVVRCGLVPAWLQVPYPTPDSREHRPCHLPPRAVRRSRSAILLHARGLLDRRRRHDDPRRRDDPRHPRGASDRDVMALCAVARIGRHSQWILWRNDGNFRLADFTG